jgi:hypothetical protein
VLCQLTLKFSLHLSTRSRRSCRAASILWRFHHRCNFTLMWEPLKRVHFSQSLRAASMLLVNINDELSGLISVKNSTFLALGDHVPVQLCHAGPHNIGGVRRYLEFGAACRLSRRSTFERFPDSVAPWGRINPCVKIITKRTHLLLKFLGNHSDVFHSCHQSHNRECKRDGIEHARWLNVGMKVLRWGVFSYSLDAALLQH